MRERAARRDHDAALMGIRVLLIEDDVSGEGAVVILRVARHEVERFQLRVDDVALDPAGRAASRQGVSVDLTTVEFDILRTLLESAGQPVTRERLAEKVLGRQFDPFDRSVDMHISKLRRKLGPRPGGAARIKTIRGVGYLYTVSVK